MRKKYDLNTPFKISSKIKKKKTSSPIEKNEQKILKVNRRKGNSMACQYMNICPNSLYDHENVDIIIIFYF